MHPIPSHLLYRNPSLSRLLSRFSCPAHFSSSLIAARHPYPSVSPSAELAIKFSRSFSSASSQQPSKRSPLNAHQEHNKQPKGTAPNAGPSSEKSTPGPEKADKSEKTRLSDKGPQATLADEETPTDIVHDLKHALLEMEGRVGTLEEKCSDLQDRLLRALAENENARHRYMKETENARMFAISKFAESILEVADNLGRAIEAHNAQSGDATALLEGVKMTQTVLSHVLDSHGIRPFDALGQPFDPKSHEALFEMHSSEHPKGHVAQVLKSGYRIKDRILRPAKVGTSRGPPE